MLDQTTLATLATFNLPPRQPSTEDPFLNVSGGGYFYLDHRDRVVVPTTTRHLLVIGQTGAAGFGQVADYDLSGVVPTASASSRHCPTGRAASGSRPRTAPSAGSSPPTGRSTRAAWGRRSATPWPSTRRAAVFIVTVKALYRFEARQGAGEDDLAQQVPELGRLQAGSALGRVGDHPDVCSTKSKVAITDNASRMHVIV